MRLPNMLLHGFNLAQQTKNTSYGFVMLLFQRMMSSSTEAILNAMEKRAARLSEEKGDVSKENILNNLTELGFEGQFEMDFESRKFYLWWKKPEPIMKQNFPLCKDLIRSAKDCINSETDAKVDYLLEKLTELKRKEENPELKFLIFTEFTATQFMLKKILEERGGFICEYYQWFHGI